MKDKLIKILLNLLMILMAVLWLYPIIWMFVVAFKPSTAPVVDFTTWAIPPFTLENYMDLFNSNQFSPLTWMFNSVFVSSITTFLALAVAALAAYGFSSFNFWGKKFWMLIILFGMMIPQESTVIPLFSLFNSMEKLNTLFSLIIPNIALPMAFIILKKFFDGIPKSLYEAATVDGCNHVKKLICISIPLAKTAFMSVAILVFLRIWNDFLWPFLSITDANKMTVPLGILLFNSEYQIERTVPLTASTVLALPLLIIFLLLQKNIIKGIALTGIKG